MKNFSKKLLVAVFAFVAMSSMNAQNFNKSDFAIYLGGSLPVGQFNKCETTALETVIPIENQYESVLGNAMFGANLGLRYTYRFDIGVGVFVNVDLIWNALDKEIREQYDAISKTKPTYVNIPILVGADYRYDFSYEFGVFGEAAIGMDLFKKTTEGWKVSDSHPLGNVKYALDESFAYEVGAGIIIANTISIGAHFYGLGNHELQPKNTEYTVTYSGNLIGIEKINMFMLRLGFHF